MRFTQDMNVVTAKGDTVGQIDRVVMDPKTKDVSHIVVRKGWLFTEDKVVPLELLASADDKQVTLRAAAGDLEQLPEYKATHYISVDSAPPAREARQNDRYAPAIYWYPPVLGGFRVWNQGYMVLPAVAEATTKNIPAGTVALKQGARVIDQDGKQVGDVDQVIIDTQQDRATHVVVSSGLLQKSHKLIPVTWINHLSNDEIHLTVSASLLDALREYEPATT